MPECNTLTLVRSDRQLELESFDSMLPILNEDLALLRPVLDSLKLAAGCRLEGETAIRSLHTPATTPSKGNVSPIRRLYQEVPLYRPCGRRYGYLGILAGQEVATDSSKVVIEALLSLAARSIAERWFRLHHCKSWILAAAPMSNRSDSLLLALDQRLRLQGIDYRAANLLGLKVPAARLPRWEDPSRRCRACGAAANCGCSCEEHAPASPGPRYSLRRI